GAHAPESEATVCHAMMQVRTDHLFEQVALDDRGKVRGSSEPDRFGSVADDLAIILGPVRGPLDGRYHESQSFDGFRWSRQAGEESRHCGLHRGAIPPEHGTFAHARAEEIERFAPILIERHAQLVFRK